MAGIKEGFKGERLVSLPENLLETYGRDPMTCNLYVRKAGFFPKVMHHYVQKDNGCSYAMLLYCTEGRGWYRIQGKTYSVEKNTYIIIPPGIPYAFGADRNAPWTIYWLHFCGKMSKAFLPESPEPKPVAPSGNSRIRERLDLFEEIYSSFSMGYIREYMIYSSMCLYMFLASFIFIEQYRHTSSCPQKENRFSAKVIHYMKENIGQAMTLKQLAEYFKYSTSHFSMLFTKETGMSPIACFISLKIQKACQYLELTDMKINEISFMLGFEEPSYFSRIFTKVMGISPSEYRKEHD